MYGCISLRPYIKVSSCRVSQCKIYEPLPSLGRYLSSFTTATYICSLRPLLSAVSGTDSATPAAGKANLDPELDTDRDCDVGELETSSASCNVTDSFAASYMEPAGKIFEFEKGNFRMLSAGVPLLLEVVCHDKNSATGTGNFEKQF